MRNPTPLSLSLGCLALGLLAPLAWSDPDPAKLAGTWYDEEHHSYQIQVQGPQVTLLKAYKSGTWNPYVGMFQPNGFNVQFRPTNTNQLNPDLPAETRTELMNRRHSFEGRLEFPDASPNPKQVRFIEEIDFIDFNEETGRLKEVEKHSEQAVRLLTKERGFTIGQIRVDDTEWNRRMQQEMERLTAERDRLQQQVIPQAQQAAEAAEQALKNQARVIDQQQQAKVRLEGEIASLRQSLQTAASQETPELQQLKRRQQQIQGTLTALLAQKEAYIAQGNINSANELTRQLTLQRQDLDANMAQMAQRFPQTQQVQAWETAISQKIAQQQRITQQLWDQSTQYFSLLDRLTSAKQTLSDRGLQLERLELQMAWASRKPVVDKVELTVKGRNHFTAEILSEPDLQRQFEEQLAAVDQLVKDTREQLPEAEAEIKRNETEKSAIRADFDEAGRAAVQAGNALHQTLQRSIKYRVLLEAGAMGTELAIAFGTGGPAGFIGELSSKLVESVSLTKIQGKDAFQLFDESALRAQMQRDANATALPLVTAPVTAADVATKTASTLTDEVVARLDERYNASRLGQVASQAEAAAASQAGLKPTLSEAGERAAVRAMNANQAVQNASQQLDLARRMAARNPAMAPLAAFEKNSVNAAMAERGRAIEQLNRIRAAQRANAQALMRNRELISQANQQLRQIRPLSLGGLVKSAGFGIATSMAVDHLKGRLSSLLDDTEKEAWESFLKKEIDLKGASASLRAASMNLTEAEDALQQLKETLTSLAYYRSQIETDQAAMLQTAQNGGFHVANNLEFFPEDPIELRLTLSGASFHENVILEKSGDPAGENRVQGRRIQASPSTTPSTASRMDRQIHQFLFPAARMGTVEERGELPLQVQLL